MNKQLLQDYCKRIHYTGTLQPDLKTLAKLQSRHIQYIPFENLNPLFKLPVKLDLESLQQKLIYEMRGGYCYEQNILFQSVLKEIGFKVRGITGRVILGKPSDHISARSHLLNFVNLAGKDYICDVGFGGQVLPSPILLHHSKPQHTTHEDYRIRPIEGSYILQARVQDSWKNLYKFDLQEQYLIDYEMANWYTSTSPASHFTTDLIVARTIKDCRQIIHNNQFITHHLNASSTKEHIKDLTHLLQLLENVFELKPPHIPNWKGVLKEIIR